MSVNSVVGFDGSYKKYPKLFRYPAPSLRNVILTVACPAKSSAIIILLFKLESTNDGLTAVDSGSIV